MPYYTQEPSNASVKDSRLTLRAVKESLHGWGYTSARLKSRWREGTPLFTTCWGRIEFSAKVLWSKSLWPALWMLPQDDRYGGWPASGEIELIEIVGEKPQEVLSSIHFGSPGTAGRQMITHVHPLPGHSTVDDWHLYAAQWAPGEIRFYVDGAHTSTCSHWWRCGLTERGVGGNFPGVSALDGPGASVTPPSTPQCSTAAGLNDLLDGDACLADWLFTGSDNAGHGADRFGFRWIGATWVTNHIPRK